MSDPSGIRKRIVAILSPIVLADMRFPDEFWAERRAGNMADDLIGGLGLDEFTVDGIEPERWWSTAVQTQDEDGEWQWTNPAGGSRHA